MVASHLCSVLARLAKVGLLSVQTSYKTFASAGSPADYAHVLGLQLDKALRLRVQKRRIVTILDPLRVTGYVDRAMVDGSKRTRMVAMVRRGSKTDKIVVSVTTAPEASGAAIWLKVSVDGELIHSRRAGEGGLADAVLVASDAYAGYLTRLGYSVER